MMDNLPGHLLDVILFKTDLKALAVLCCTNTTLQKHIQDPSFVSEYYSQLKPSVLHTSCDGSRYLIYHHPDHESSRSLKNKRNTIAYCHIVGYCSGLLLIVIGYRLCVTNPLTKKFRFLTLSNDMSSFATYNTKNQAGLAVNQIDRTTQTFKFVYMFIMWTGKPNETRYGFRINAGDSLTYSKTTLACHPSKLYSHMKNPVYLDGSLHWLREDGSIVAFNPETEQARLIHVEFPNGLSSKTLFASDDSTLTLVSASEEIIYVYALENILSDHPKWTLVKQIQNGVIDKNGVNWWAEAYNGKYLVLRGYRENIERTWMSYNTFIHVYNLSDNKWVAMHSVPPWLSRTQHFILFTPSPSSVLRLDEISDGDDDIISSLRLIMGLVDANSSEEVEKQLEIKPVEEREEKGGCWFG